MKSLTLHGNLQIQDFLGTGAHVLEIIPSDPPRLAYPFRPRF